MGNLSVALLDQQRNMAPNYVPAKPVDHEQIGWDAFFAGRHFHACQNEMQRQGWKAAQAHGLQMIINGTDYTGPTVSVRW